VKYILVVDSEFDDLQFHVALAKNGMFLRPLRNGTARLSFLPPHIKDQTHDTKDFCDVTIRKRPVETVP
jgi:hypothetical protein